MTEKELYLKFLKIIMDIEEKERKRFLWYLRPSHKVIMEVWERFNNLKDD